MKITEELNKYIGYQIRLYRKLRNYTLKQFAELIHKSISTVSKYENGTISIEINTLYEIADALRITISQLLPPETDQAQASFQTAVNPACSFFSKSNVFYMYQCFTLDRKALNNGILISVIEIERKANDYDRISFYSESIDPAENYRNCKYIYKGRILYFEYIVYMELENIYQKGDRFYICAKEPFDVTNMTTGLYSGISQSMRNPAAAKVIFSTSLLKCDEELRKKLLITSKDSFDDIRRTNALVIR